ncbi:MAG: methionyl-tRNA formyltransferase [Sphingomonas sp.]
MRIVFMGTPDFSVPVLQALINFGVDSGHDVVAAYSQPPRRAGRGKAVTPSPVQARAEALGIPVRTPLTLRDPATQAEFAALDADVAVVAAYGLILPRPVLEAPRLGCLNVHASLLPRWRGAAPIQRAVLAGDAETGVCIMQMEAGLDTGPVRLEGRTSVSGKTAGELTDELSAMGARLMVQVLSDIEAYPPVAQPEDGVTHAPKIDKAEARLDWSRSAVEVERQIRAFNPVPGAFFEVAGERIKILAAEVDRHPGGGCADGEVLDDNLTIACAEGRIRPLLLQRAGRGVMTSAELLRGFPIPPGTQLA